MTHKNEHLNVNSIRNSIDSISNDKNSFGISATSCYQSSPSSSSISSSSQTIINNQLNIESSMMITQSSQLNKSSNGSNGTTNINKRVSSGSKYSNSFAKNVTGSTGSSSKQSGGKKTKGRVKIKMEFIDNKLRRYTTFSKRKTGIMKKAYELSTLTGTQVMLLVASETGHVYTFATRKLQPMITSDAGKALIQTCLNSPDTGQISGNQNNSNDVIITTNGHSHANLNELCYDDTSNELNQQRSLATGNPHHPHHHNHHHHHQAEIHGRSLGSNSSVTTSNSHLGVNNNNNNNNDSNTNNNNGTVSSNDQRMSATGFEETELSYSVSTNTPQDDKNLFASPAPSCASSLSSSTTTSAATTPPILLANNQSHNQPHHLMHQHRNPNLQHSIHHQHLHHNDNSIQTAFIQTAPCQSPGHNPHATHSQHEQSLISQQESSMLTDSPQHFETQHLHIGLNETIQSSYQNGSLVGSNSDRVISSSSPSSSLPMISSSNATIVSNRTLTPIIAQPIQMPSSIGGNSFFNSSTSGTSPPPLTPNGLLSGLHSFLFADSVGLVDPFGIDGNVDISSCLNSSNGNTFFSTSSSSIETEQGSNAGGNNHSTNADLTASALRLPPFCSI
ncbi:Serum response factor [Sarcoptes scabiei]|uniref:Serum response factor homolog n=1 Tax=Sarcoptes scabiei TaxID=52283 RepID=A0A834V996_SARSC|nr:Serum response factor [Sarcoptes scabiei]